MSENGSEWPLKITVPGRPIGKGRARVSSKVNKKGKRWAYTPAKTKSYEDMIIVLAKQAMRGRSILTGPIQLSVDCYFKAKKDEWNVGLPDWDNIGKLVSDSLNGVVYNDDRQVACAVVVKTNDSKELDGKVVITVNSLIPFYEIIKAST